MSTSYRRETHFRESSVLMELVEKVRRLDGWFFERNEIGPVYRKREAKIGEHAEPFRGFINFRRTQTDVWRTDGVPHRRS